MKRPIFQMLSISILIAILLTACGGQATTAPPQIEQPTEAPEATKAPEEAEEVEEPAEAPEEEAPATSEGIELPIVSPADVPD